MGKELTGEEIDRLYGILKKEADSFHEPEGEDTHKQKKGGFFQWIRKILPTKK